MQCVPAGLPHRAALANTEAKLRQTFPAVLYISINHGAALSPRNSYLQVFHIGLQVLPAPVRSLLEDSLEARCRLTSQLMHIEKLHQLLSPRVFLHCHSPQHTQVWCHALCNSQSVSQRICFRICFPVSQSVRDSMWWSSSKVIRTT